GELVSVLTRYFAGLLADKKGIVAHVVGEFERIYQAKDDNVTYEKELKAELDKLRGARQKYMDLYADDLISREELNEKIGGSRKRIEQLENEMKTISDQIIGRDRLETILTKTFKEIEDIADVSQMTNAQLKKIVRKIEVDRCGNVDIYLKPFGEPGVGESVPNIYDHT
ncbi:MAG: recombinase family protein, partial [Candidatus Gallimonas sp.]